MNRGTRATAMVRPAGGAGRRVAATGPRTPGTGWAGTRRRGRDGARQRQGGLPRPARVAFFVVFVYLFVSFCLQEVEVFRLARQVRQLENQAAALEAENASLVKEIEYTRSDAYIEQVAREELGLVWPNEIPYVPGRRIPAGASGP